MENQPTYHPKAAFALYLNQAEHNLVSALAEITNNKNIQVNSKKNKTLNAITELDTAQISKLQQLHFRFLKADKQEDKLCNFKIVVEKLYSLRNYYSHNFHSETPLVLSKNCENDMQFKNYLEAKYEQIAEDLKSVYESKFLEHLNYQKAKIELSKILKIKINENFDSELNKKNEANIQINKNRNKETEVKIKDEILHEKIGAYMHYRLFREDKNSFYFEKKAVVLLASFFLEKRQINLLTSKVRGFKRTQEKQAKATRDCFSYYHKKDAESNFVSQNKEVAFFLDAISYLSKIPKIVLENTENKTYKFTKGSFYSITDMIYNQYPKKRAKIRLAKNNLDEISALTDLEGKEIKGTQNFLSIVERKIGKKALNDYREIILNSALENEKIRTEKDRFTYFALQYIDDFNLLPNIHFKVYTGDFEIEKEIKEYNGEKFPPKEKIKRATDYVKLKKYESSKRQKVGHFYYETWDEFVDDFTENEKRLHKEKKHRKLFEQIIKYNPANYDYYIKENNVFFKAEKNEKEYFGSISVYELRNLVFALMDKGSQAVENAIFKDLENSTELYNKILTGEQKERINEFVEQNFYKYSQKENQTYRIPHYIEKWLNEKQYTDNDFRNDILDKLKFIKKEANRLQKKQNELKKYEKIREIVKFVNRFNQERRGKDKRRGYLTILQHEELEKLIGTLPKSKQELLLFLKDNEIKTHKKDFAQILKEKTEIDNIFSDILQVYIKWASQIEKEVNRQPIIYSEAVGKYINITRKKYDNQRIEQNIERILKQNIVLPRKFVVENFYKTENITHKITEATKNLELPNFYDNVTDYKNDHKNYRKFGIKINRQKTKDQVLLLMTREYQKQIVKTNNEKLRINTEELNVLKNKDITIEYDLLSFEFTDEIKKKFEAELGKNISNLFKQKEVKDKIFTEETLKKSKVRKIYNRNKDKIVEIAGITETKKIVFDIRDYDKILPMLMDKRFEKILRFYFADKNNILYLDRKKYDKKAEITEAEKQNCKLEINDLQDVVTKIDCEQLKIVDLFLKLEKEILFVLIKDKNNKIPTKVIKGFFNPNYARVRGEQAKYEAQNKAEIKELIEELKAGENRIEPKTLFIKKEFKKGEYEPVIKNYRNSAFHNTIPNIGMFENGIGEIEKLLTKIEKQKKAYK